MMKRGIARYTAFCLAAGFTFSQSGMLTMAAGTDLVLVGVGSADKAQTVQTVEGTVMAEQEEAAEDIAEEAAEETVTEENVPEETEAAEEIFQADPDAVGTTGFAQCEEYLNVRTEGSTDSEVVGKIYPNGSLEIIDADDNGWYYVRSGNVEGYVAAQYVATGSEAESIAATAGYTTAQVGAEVLNLRASAGEDGEVIGAIYSSDEVEVVEDCGDWVKVVAGDGTYGYVSADYVETNTYYSTGETLEEEQARLDQEWLDYLAQQEAEQAAAEAAYIASLGYTESYAEPSYDTGYSYSYSDAQAQADAAAYEAQSWADNAAAASTDAQSAADAQYQVYLDAQAAADAATQTMDEESVYAAAAEAQAAYEAYLSAQADADAAAQAEADAAYAAQAAAEAAENVEDTYYEDTYTDDTYTDDTYTDDTYTEDTYVEDTYTEDTEDSYTEQTYSSVGQQIADYAVQFVGNPYVWGGTSLTNGADCSGFVLSVFANFGISLPHSAAAQSGYGTAVSGDSLQPGDLLFYGDGSGIGHVSIYIGNGQVVHASSSTTGIIISSVGYRTPCAYRRLV